MKRTKSMKSPRGGVKKTKSRKTSRKSLRGGVKLTKSKKSLRGGIKRKKSRKSLRGGGNEASLYTELAFPQIVDYIHPSGKTLRLFPGYWMLRKSRGAQPGTYTVVGNRNDGESRWKVQLHPPRSGVTILEKARSTAISYGSDGNNIVKPRSLIPPSEGELWNAAKDGDLNRVIPLVEQGSNLHEANDKGYTALHFACRLGSVAIVRFLLQHGARTDVVTRTSNSTPLHYAAANGKTDAVRMLIDFKADVNAKDKWGTTPLADAVKEKWTDTAEVLKAAGGGM